MTWRRGLALVLLALAARPALALDKLRVSVATGTIFTTLDVGTAAGIWARHGLEVTSIVGDGEAPMDKMMVSGDIDAAIGGGNSMAYRLKGVPDIAVADALGPPYDFALAVAWNSPIKSASELKGKTVGVTSVGSTTDFLVHDVSRAEGWGDNGITTVGLGSTRARLAALAGGDIAAMMTTPELGYDSEEQHGSRVILVLGDLVKAFMSHSILFRQEIVDRNPDLVRRFLAGWFETVAWMKVPANKPVALPIVARSLGISQTAAARSYDAIITRLSPDGVFVKDEVDAMREAMPAFGVLDKVPDATELYTDRFVPVKVGG